MRAHLRPSKDPEADLGVSFLELNLEDTLNGRSYDTIITATPRGLTFSVIRRKETKTSS